MTHAPETEILVTPATIQTTPTRRRADRAVTRAAPMARVAEAATEPGTEPEERAEMVRAVVTEEAGGTVPVLGMEAPAETREPWARAARAARAVRLVDKGVLVAMVERPRAMAAGAETGERERHQMVPGEEAEVAEMPSARAKAARVVMAVPEQEPVTAVREARVDLVPVLTQAATAGMVDPRAAAPAVPEARVGKVAQWGRGAA